MQRWALRYGFVTQVFSLPGTCCLAHCFNKASSPQKHESHKVGMHLCHGIGSMGTGSVLNISAPLIFAFHSKPWKGKVTKCVFTRSTQPAQLQLSPNLVLPSFSGLAGKYRFSRYSRHIIYLIKCVFWHVHYLPDGLMDGSEQTLSFVQTATLFAGGESSRCAVPVSAPCPFTAEQKASAGAGRPGSETRRAGGTWCWWSSCPEPRAGGPTVGMDLNLHVYVARCVCICIYIQWEGVLILIREDRVVAVHLVFYHQSLHPAM